MERNRFLSLLLLPLVATLASGVFPSGSGEDLKGGRKKVGGAGFEKISSDMWVVKDYSV